MSRASPLSPDARRASIIAATVPLLRAHGRTVTTAQIAMAAGVAEGTLFRVFPDKDALIAVAIATALDPAPTEAALAHIDRDQSLRGALLEAVDIIQRRVERIWQLIAVLGMFPPQSPRVTDERDGGVRAQLAAIFEAHRGELRCEPAHAARMLRALTFAGTHPKLVDTQPLTAGEIVTLLLDGIRAREDEED